MELPMLRASLRYRVTYFDEPICEERILVEMVKNRGAWASLVRAQDNLNKDLDSILQ